MNFEEVALPPKCQNKGFGWEKFALYLFSMAFKADVLRILIAAPSDLTEERATAIAVINACNALHFLTSLSGLQRFAVVVGSSLNLGSVA